MMIQRAVGVVLVMLALILLAVCAGVMKKPASRWVVIAYVVSTLLLVAAMWQAPWLQSR